MSGTAEPAEPVKALRRRVIILGASNAARGISTLVETAQRLCGEPIELMAAVGHGRSYGIQSSVLGRALPGIARCGLWEDLERRPPLPTIALVADLGNDLLYEVPVERIAQWVEECLDRLAIAGAHVVVMPLPLENIAALSEWRFRLMRTMLFPRSRLSLEEVSDRARRLDQQVAEVARKRSLMLGRLRASWYGFDPIHLKMRHWAVAWHENLSFFARGEKNFSHAVGSFPRWVYLRRLRPQWRRFFGRNQYQEQPSGRLDDGTTVSFY